MSKKNRIFIGVENIANIHSNFCKAFRTVGISCDSYLWSTELNHFYNNDSKYLFLFNSNRPPFRIFGKNIFHLINKGLKLFHFSYLLLKYDIFIFVSIKSFDKRNKSLSILRKLNKKVVCIFAGCMERDVNFEEADSDYICNNCLDLNKQRICSCGNLKLKKERISIVEKQCQYILAQPDISTYVKNKNKLVWFYLVDDYKPITAKLLNKYDQEKINIVHLPSNSKVKQTHIISPVLEKFKPCKNVNVIIKEQFWKREKVLKTLEEAHILINSIGTGYNTTAVEAMARGCVVLNSHPDWFKEMTPEAPIIHISSGSLESTVKQLLENKEYLKNFAKKSIEYYLKYHYVESAGNYYKNKLDLK